jgi:hypothetical protein
MIAQSGGLSESIAVPSRVTGKPETIPGQKSACGKFQPIQYWKTRNFPQIWIAQSNAHPKPAVRHPGGDTSDTVFMGNTAN